MASIYWERESYSGVERLLRQSAEFCSEHDAWRLNMAHAHYMQERYADAIRYYQPLVVRNADNLLSLPAIVLANLCVCYIMSSQVRWHGMSVPEASGLHCSCNAAAFSPS